jgi:hypothetical protein
MRTGRTAADGIGCRKFRRGPGRRLLHRVRYDCPSKFFCTKGLSTRVLSLQLQTASERRLGENWSALGGGQHRFQFERAPDQIVCAPLVTACPFDRGRSINLGATSGRHFREVIKRQSRSWWKNGTAIPMPSLISSSQITKGGFQSRKKSDSTQRR